MVPVIVLVAALCLGFIIKLATHPASTLLATLRVLLFLLAAGLTVLYLTTPDVRSAPDNGYVLLLIAGCTAAWLLTFALAATVRRRR